jgi:ATP-dependent DNA ligase
LTGRINGPEWLHELKFDGYRMHGRLDRGAVRLLTRTGLDWTHKYLAIAAAVALLPARQAYLDGELCGVRPDATTSFSPSYSQWRRITADNSDQVDELNRYLALIEPDSSVAAYHAAKHGNTR